MELGGKWILKEKERGVRAKEKKGNFKEYGMTEASVKEHRINEIRSQ
jgi:hypothetical protein